MKKILLSIKPRFVDEIRRGNKLYEYRKILPKKNCIRKLLIYESCPVKRVVAECDIESFIWMNTEKLWEKTASLSGIDKCFYDQYFDNRPLAGAIKMRNIRFFDKVKTIDEYNIKVAPQSFCYIEDLAESEYPLND